MEMDYHVMHAKENMETNNAPNIAKPSYSDNIDEMVMNDNINTINTQQQQGDNNHEDEKKDVSWKNIEACTMFRRDFVKRGKAKNPTWGGEYYYCTKPIKKPEDKEIKVKDIHNKFKSAGNKVQADMRRQKIKDLAIREVTGLSVKDIKAAFESNSKSSKGCSAIDPVQNTMKLKRLQQLNTHNVSAREKYKRELITKNSHSHRTDDDCATVATVTSTVATVASTVEDMNVDYDEDGDEKEDDNVIIDEIVCDQCMEQVIENKLNDDDTDILEENKVINKMAEAVEYLLSLHEEMSEINIAATSIESLLFLVQENNEIDIAPDSFMIPNLDVHDNSTPSDEIVDINLATELEVMQQEKVKLASNEKTHENDFDIAKRNNVQVDKSASIKDMNKSLSAMSTRTATTNKSSTKRKKRKQGANKEKITKPRNRKRQQCAFCRLVKWLTVGAEQQNRQISQSSRSLN